MHQPKRARPPKEVSPPPPAPPPEPRYTLRLPELSPGKWSREINGGRFFITNRDVTKRPDNLTCNILAEVERVEYSTGMRYEPTRGDGCELANANVMSQSKAMLHILFKLYNTFGKLTKEEQDEIQPVLELAGVKGWKPRPSPMLDGAAVRD